MMTLTENAAYLKGLAEGLNVDESKPEGKLITKMLALISDMADSISDLEDECEELRGYIEEIDDDLATVEDDLYEDEEEDEDEEELFADILAATAMATDEFLARRAAEGENTRRDITEKMQNVMAAAHEIAALSAAHIADCRTRLEERLHTLMGDVPIDEARLLTECALFADRMAIDEELARLESHREAFFSYLDSDEPVGRPLDFLMQEFNRETNTIGSKANHAGIARLVVTMKTELEKIREQIQNLE